MSVHRFIEFKSIGRGADCDLVLDDPGVAEVHARLALRADGSLWLLGDVERPCLVDRGSGWAAATRLCLCAGDRVRLGESELTSAELCSLAGVGPDEVVAGAAIASDVPGMAAPRPLSARAGMMKEARRDPGTGQIEASGKERK